jgi:RNA polymerase sigma factor (sigma-70 family)
MSDPHSPDQPMGWVLLAVERYESALVVYSSRLLGDRESARDVVQETYLRLCRQQRERVEPHLAEWLFTVCRNRALDLLRREGRMARLLDESARQLAATAPDPAETSEKQESAAEVMKYLGDLPNSQQEVIRLRFSNGFSYKEISRITGHSVTNVGFLMHTGIKSLRARLLSAEARASHPLAFAGDGAGLTSPAQRTPRAEAQY